jgi:hypothetical protein
LVTGIVALLWALTLGRAGDKKVVYTALKGKGKKVEEKPRMNGLQ